MNACQLSERLLLQVKKGEPFSQTLFQLESLPLESLLANQFDREKKAFWINIYNASYLVLRWEQGVQKPAIFREKRIKIAGLPLSLDHIEHGILRRNRFKWSFGYLRNPLAPALLKKLAVKKLDWRIHFALNCGAVSCPPIAFYTPEKIDGQLESATLSFLEAETEVKADKNEIHLTRLFRWYRADFGGNRGIRRILNEKLGIPTKGMQLVYKEYDWEEAVNFSDDFSKS